MVKTISFLSGLLILLVFLSSCYWIQYEQLMDTHLTLMEDYSTKLQDLAEDHQIVLPRDWVEFEYPGERASEFVSIVEPRFGDRPSLLAFRKTLVLYSQLIASPEVLHSPDAWARIRKDRASLLVSITATRQALAAEE